MFEGVKALFGRHESLIRACEGGNLERIADSLRRSELWFLCLPSACESGIDPRHGTTDDALEQVKDTVRDLKERVGYVPFRYDRDAFSCMPVFTNEEHATNFVQTYAARRQRILTFQLFSADGPKLVPTFRNCDLVVFNDGSPDEYNIGNAQIAKLVSMFE